ncbi:hypothetical protein ACM42_09760 [Bradyrhizobium sp. CCBAU 25338]|nr:hypothetical protein [Bradyrhizobium sp. CCBAU 25338]
MQRPRFARGADRPADRSGPDLQFSSDSTFVRAFRRKFGLTPGEIRDKSQAWQRGGGAPPAPDDIFYSLSKH